MVYASLLPPRHNHTNLKWVWKLQCHTRLKFFVWKIMNDGLPSISNIRKRGFLIPDMCPLCGSTPETLEHVLMNCSAAIASRTTALPHCDTNPNPTGFHNWIQTNAKLSSHSHNHIPKGTLFIYHLWHLWIARNKKIFECLPFNPSLISKEATTKATEFHFFAAKPGKQKTQIASLVGWYPPPLNHIKLNTDGAHSNISNLIAAAGVIRDSNGNWIVGFSKFLGSGDALLAEIWALKLGLCLCVSKGLKNIFVETDSAIAAHLILCHNISHTHPLYPLIDDCRSALTVSLSSLHHIHREGNMCADILAKTALTLRNDLQEFIDIPPYVLSAFKDDQIGKRFSRRIGVG